MQKHVDNNSPFIDSKRWESCTDPLYRQSKRQ